MMFDYPLQKALIKFLYPTLIPTSLFPCLMSKPACFISEVQNPSDFFFQLFVPSVCSLRSSYHKYLLLDLDSGDQLDTSCGFSTLAVPNMEELLQGLRNENDIEETLLRAAQPSQVLSPIRLNKKRRRKMSNQVLSDISNTHRNAPSRSSRRQLQVSRNDNLISLNPFLGENVYKKPSPRLKHNEPTTPGTYHPGYPECLVMMDYRYTF